MKTVKNSVKTTKSSIPVNGLSLLAVLLQHSRSLMVDRFTNH